MAIPSVVQGTVEFAGKVFEVDSPRGLTWLESVTSFRFEPTGANKPYTARKESGKGGDYWYGYRKMAGRLHKKYIGKSSEISTAKLEEIAEALNTPPQPRVTDIVAETSNRGVTGKVTEVTETSHRGVTDKVTYTRVVDRLTALELQVKALQESLEALRGELRGKSESGDSSELPTVTDSELPIEVGNLDAEREDIEFLKRLLAKKSPLISSDLWQEIERLKERNRQLCVKTRAERQELREKNSELEYRTDSMTRRVQEKQIRLDELEIQLETERADREKLEAQLSDLKQNSAAASKGLPEVANILKDLRKALGKKSTASLADVEKILEIIEGDGNE